ncbi:sugar ABC transporter substrate-binding protein, partial [Streptomyces sp. TRM76130]|nr:sugar ABC transporter substrate-binding protein [Streptomyces sp. TRM76130]
PGATKEPVAEARRTAIPVVGLDSGRDGRRSAGLLSYFGQGEGVAGRSVGDRLDALGAEHTRCVVHRRGDAVLGARRAGVEAACDGPTEILPVEGTDLEAVRDAV